MQNPKHRVVLRVHKTTRDAFYRYDFGMPTNLDSGIWAIKVFYRGMVSFAVTVLTLYSLTNGYLDTFKVLMNHLNSVFQILSDCLQGEVTK